MGALALFVLGLLVLVVGAELVVRGASNVAIRFRVSPMIIGLTIVSIGTSTPELAIGIVAGSQGNGALAVGNIAGTNMLNLLFILGLSALIRPLPLHLQIFKLELPMIVVAAALMMIMAWDGHLSRFDGILLLLASLVYTLLLIVVTRRASQAARKEFRDEYGEHTLTEIKHPWHGTVLHTVVLIGGIVATVVGAELLVRGATSIAQSLGVSTTIIGLTIVAIGTSAPELVTTILSTIKNDRDVAVGNLLGSSIYNILFILGATCVFSPAGLPVERNLLMFDIPLMAGVAVGAIPIFLTGKLVSRWEGGLGVAIYLVYVLCLIVFRS